MVLVHSNTTGNKFFYFYFTQNYETLFVVKFVAYIYSSKFIHNHMYQCYSSYKSALIVYIYSFKVTGNKIHTYIQLNVHSGRT